jgi:putative ABC transport system permease protein
VIFQFIISISLIICTLVIHRQNNYVSTFNLGFNKENIIYASVNDDIIKHIQSFKEEIKKIPEITAFTFSEAPIGKSVPNWGIDLVNKGEQKHVNFAKMGISDNFLSFFGIKLMQGESFSDNSIKQYDFILNETAKLEFNIDHISEARINITNDVKQGAIIGVVRDFNFESMHTPIRPIVFMY